MSGAARAPPLPPTLALVPPPQNPCKTSVAPLLRWSLGMREPPPPKALSGAMSAPPPGDASACAHARRVYTPRSGGRWEYGCVGGGGGMEQCGRAKGAGFEHAARTIFFSACKNRDAEQRATPAFVSQHRPHARVWKVVGGRGTRGEGWYRQGWRVGVGR